MAQLTDQLTTISSGPSPIAVPGKAGGASFFKGLADVASGLMGVRDSISQSDARYQQSQDTSAGNDVVKGAMGILLPQPETTSPPTTPPILSPGIDAELEGANTAARQATVAQMASLTRARSAEEQGRLPVGSVNLRMEAFLQQQLRDHPGSEMAVMETFKQFGFDSFIARDARLQAQIAESTVIARSSQQIEAEGIDIKAFVASGGDVSAPREEQIRLGRESLVRDRNRAEAAAAITANNAAATAGDARAKEEVARNERTLFGAIQRDTEIDQGNLVVLLRTGSTSGTVADQAAWVKALPQISEYYTTKMLALKSRTLASLPLEASPELRARTAAYYDGLLADAKKYIFDAADDRAAKALGRLQAEYKVTAAKAMPLYFAMNSMFGQTYTNALLEGHAPGVNTEALIKEFESFDPAHPEAMGPTMLNVGRVLRGELSIPDMDPVEAQKVLPKIVATQTGVLAQVLRDGKVDTTEVEAYRRPTEEILNAAMAIPRDAPATSRWRASDSLLSPNALKAATLLVGVNEEAGREIIFGSRQFAFRTVQELSGRTTGTYWDFAYRKGKFVPVLNEERWKKEQASLQAASASTGSESYRPAEQLPRPTWATEANPEVRAHFDTLNRAVNYLVETDKYDEQVPTDVTPGDRRDAYARGLPVTSPTQPGAVPASAKSAIDAVETGLISDINTIQTQGQAQDITRNSAQELGIPVALANWFIGKESSWNGEARPVDANGKRLSSAYGWAQFIDSTAQDRGLYQPGPGGFDHRNDPTRAIPEGLKYLKELYVKNGNDWVKALKAYGTLAGNNPKSEQWAKEVQQLIGNSDG